jgi:hypothetical protein
MCVILLPSHFSLCIDIGYIDGDLIGVPPSLNNTYRLFFVNGMDGEWDNCLNSVL